MLASELDKILKANNIGRRKLFGSGNMLFDRDYSVPKHSDFVKARESAAYILGWYEYAADRADCDNYAFMALGLMMQWFLKNTSYTGAVTVGVVWGVFNDESHMWNDALTDKGFHHVNYGQIVTPQSYKGVGSITA